MNKLALGLVLVSASASGIYNPVQARLGQSIHIFRVKQKERCKLNKIVVQDEMKYFSFSLLLDSASLASAPGFKGGMTITVKRGRIVGQSLAISLGSNIFTGTGIACEQSFDFACETLGRTKPKEEMQVKEKLLIQQAIGLALAGQPQELKFPDTKGKVVFKRSQEGNLLVAATKD